MTELITIGQHFGHLTIIAKDTRPLKHASWLCRCDCGQEIYLPASKLLHGKVRSCGCKSRSKINLGVDLTGRRFHHLKVLSKSNNPRRLASWLCLCDCGTTCELHTSELLNGKSKSCGCGQHAGSHPEKDLTGQRFGHLTVISRSTDQNHKAIWNCVCDCGQEIEVYTSALVNGKRTSCSSQCRYHTTRKMASLLGKRFNHLVVKDCVEIDSHVFRWLCLCDCGEYTLATTEQLTHGHKRSCGCNLRLNPVKTPRHHDLTKAQLLGTNDAIRHHKANSNTGIKGIHKRKRLILNPYEVSITAKGEYHFIGQFPTIEQAQAARLAAEAKYHQPLIDQLDKEKPTLPK